MDYGLRPFYAPLFYQLNHFFTVFVPLDASSLILLDASSSAFLASAACLAARLASSSAAL